MPVPIKICYLESRQLAFSAQKVTMDDFESKGHPNVLPFSGTLLLVDSPSNKPPQGADGHLIQVPKDVAKRLLPTLVGMAVNYSSEFDRHEVRRKIGVITATWLDGDHVKVRGHIWSKDFPEAAKEIKANKGRLGMSMELADIWVADKDSKVWKLRDFKFTGGTILYKKAAAYHNTSLAASREKYYVKALAAAAAVLGNSKSKGEADMPTSKKASRSSGEKRLAAQLAAAVSAGVSANLEGVLDRIEASMESNGKIVRLMARHLVETAKASKKVKAAKTDDSSVDDSEDISAAADTSDISAAADTSAAADDDLTRALKAAGKKGGEDDSSEEDWSEDDGSEEDMSAAADASEEDDSSVEAALEDMSEDFSPSGTGGSYADSSEKDSSTGGVNQKANKKAGKKSKGVSASKQKIRASADVIDRLEAAEESLSRLTAENASYKKHAKKQKRALKAMMAQVQRAAELTNRETLTPEIHSLLEKEGYDVNDMRASGAKLTVAQIDAVLSADPRLGLDPVTKMQIKNQLTQQGLLEDGKVERFKTH